MRTPGTQPPHVFDERGFTLIELLVAMVLGVIVTLAAFSLLQFTTADVSRTSAEVQVDQSGRTALEKLILALHSSCVGPQSSAPIRTGSKATVLRFISQANPTNSNGEPAASLSTVRLHEVIYTPASGSTEGTLTEKSWLSSGVSSEEYKFNEKETPTNQTLLTGVSETVTPTPEKEKIPVFQYYRYYRTGDKTPEYGKLEKTPMTAKETESAEAKEVAEVTVSFTVAPEGRESTAFSRGHPVALEDSAILRLSPSSESSSSINLPCAQSE